CTSTYQNVLLLRQHFPDPRSKRSMIFWLVCMSIVLSYDKCERRQGLMTTYLKFLRNMSKAASSKKRLSMYAPSTKSFWTGSIIMKVSALNVITFTLMRTALKGPSTSVNENLIDRKPTQKSLIKQKVFLFLGGKIHALLLPA